MQKLKVFFNKIKNKNKNKNLLSIFLLSIFLLNMSYYTTITPAQNISSIKVGLSNYQNFTSIPIGFNNSSSNISLSFGTNELLKNSLELNQNEKLIVKPISKYSIITNNSYSSYSEARAYADTLQDGFAYLKGDSWYVIDGSFNHENDASVYWNITNQVEENEDINIIETIKKIEQSQGKVELISNSIGIYINDKLNFIVQENLYMKASDGLFTLGSNTYRNIIQIRNSTSSINLISAINLINIQEYLYSVVPNEMPALWHEEALKAQAIACRNFAYSNMNVHLKDGYNICNTTHCQVYSGIKNEHEKTNIAVNETANIFAYYNNEIINAVYSSSNGGYSENSEDVWYQEVPYLRTIEDIHEVNAKEWTRSFSFDELSRLANIGDVKELEIDILTENQRVLNLILIGTEGTKIVEKDAIRTFFEPTSGGSLESKNFYIEDAIINIKESTDPNFIKDEIIEVFDIFGIISNNQEDNQEDKKQVEKFDIEQDVVILSAQGEETGALKSKFAMNYVGEIHKLEYHELLEEDRVLENTDIYNNNLAPNSIIKKSILSDSTSLVTLVGRGWGHGVGMSQYGANSLANKGYTYDEILKYYYTGIEVR